MNNRTPARLFTMAAALVAAMGLSGIPAGASDTGTRGDQSGDRGVYPISQTKQGHEDKFRQLTEILPTPNVYRTGGGKPGPQYWQQRADYDMEVTLDDVNQRIVGSQVVTYTNKSPDTLRYIWFQLDQNRFDARSHSRLTETNDDTGRMAYDTLRRLLVTRNNDWGMTIKRVALAEGGAALAHVIDDTKMRVDLVEPLAPGDSVAIAIDWQHPVVTPGAVLSNRNGLEVFDDGAANYFLSFFYPRVAAYTDYDGWITKSFLYVEYALEFGDYDVAITVPDTFTVAATGELQNPRRVLSDVQRRRLDRAAQADRPVAITLPAEAAERRAETPDGTRTWRYRAENVRDFAFAASPAFIWDAMGHQTRDGRTVMAMSLYPQEGEPIWSRYSTQAVAHTLDVYGRMTFPYPYPVAISVNAPIRSGMEFPMIVANAPRPAADDGTYSRREKYGLIGVVIHEIGHQWLPMVINTDERQFIWLDEGLNSFLDTLAQMEWEPDHPAADDLPGNAIRYMTSANQVPVMVQGDALNSRGGNAYTKVAAALSVLREVVIGRELFDDALRAFAERWKFKRPQPADFFRTMEEVSGRDLDWFWRGWFYTTTHVDVALTGVTEARIDTQNPDTEAEIERAQDAARAPTIMAERNKAADLDYRVERFPGLKDFYNEHDRFTVTPKQRRAYEDMVAGLEMWQKRLLSDDSRLYFLHFANKGGLVTPLPLDIAYEDGSNERLVIPAEIWRRNQSEVTKLLIRDKAIRSVEVAKYRSIADADHSDNVWPRAAADRRIELKARPPRPNLMRDMGETAPMAGEDHDG
ncbi:M1 family metallopeptidase [Rhodothalassium salexigens]|uniref:M1 family metallopeptidase n=1 Tax=Rhodothalassium salexigens TaxID=1086 RepID=UPI0019149059|nr:M1 family metallopeptidase [Rhodothalassium salexigens]